MATYFHNTITVITEKDDGFRYKEGKRGEEINIAKWFSL